jgi:hypothetical protein
MGSSFGRRWMSSTKVIRICSYRRSLKAKKERGRKGKKKCMEEKKSKQGGINNTGGEIFFNTTKKEGGDI